MKRKSIGAVLILLIINTALQAQNDKFNWGLGYMGSAYSYSAVLESKATSPYKYNVGKQITLTRYLSHNFDLELSAGESQIGYHTGYSDGSPMYTATQLYDGAIHLKYKFDNGYIIKEENYRVSPFVMVGAGASHVALTDALDMMVPVGFGINAQMGKRLSFTYQSSFRHNVQAENAYWAHGVGLKYNFGKIGIKRMTATRERERERKLERIAKRNEEREKRRLALEESRRQREESYAARAQTAFSAPAEEVVAVVEPAEPTPIEAQAKTIAEIDIPKPQPEVTLFNPKEEDPTAKAIDLQPTVEANTATAPTPQPTRRTLPVTTAAPTPPTAPATAPDEDYCANSLQELSELGPQITFKYGSSNVNSDMIPALKAVVEVMQRCPSTSYAIMAHTDASGDAQSNFLLSEKRGMAIRGYLIEKGIPADRLVILPCGEYAANSDKSASDRCISFKINHRVKN